MKFGMLPQLVNLLKLMLYLNDQKSRERAVLMGFCQIYLQHQGLTVIWTVIGQMSWTTQIQ